MNKFEQYFLKKLKNDETKNRVRDLWASPNVSLDFIENNFDKEIDWHRISQNPNLTEEFIERHLDKNWSWGPIFSNFSLDFTERHLDKARECWFYNIRVVHNHSKLTLEFVEQHLDENWNWESLMRYNIVSEKILEKCYIELQKQNCGRFSYGFKELENYNSLSLEFIEEHLDWNWNWYLIAEHPEINFEFINKFKDNWGKSSWNYFFENKLVDENYVIENLEIEWDWKYISEILSDWKLIEKCPNKNWDWEILSSKSSMGFLEKHLELNWNWYYVSHNPNLTFEFVERHLDKDWDWLGMWKLKDC